MDLPIDEQLIEALAELALLKFPPTEQESLTADLHEILEYMQEIIGTEVGGEKQSIDIPGVHCRLREDDIIESGLVITDLFPRRVDRYLKTLPVLPDQEIGSDGC